MLDLALSTLLTAVATQSATVCVSSAEIAPTGFIQVTPTVRLAKIEERLDHAAPPRLDASGRERLRAQTPLGSVTVGVDWRIRGTRRSTGVEGRDGIIVARARYDFDGAFTAHAVRVPVSGDVTFSASIELDLKDDWCPAVRVAMSHRWNRRPTARVLGQNVDISGLANAEARRVESRFKSQLESAFACAPWRAQVEKSLQKITAAHILDSKTNCAVRFSPSRFIWAGVRTRPGRIAFPMALEGRFVEAASGDAEVDLPTLVRDSSNQTGAPNVALRFTLPWSLVQDLLADQETALLEGVRIDPREDSMTLSGRGKVVVGDRTISAIVVVEVHPKVIEDTIRFEPIGVTVWPDEQAYLPLRSVMETWVRRELLSAWSLGTPSLTEPAAHAIARLRGGLGIDRETTAPPIQIRSITVAAPGLVVEMASPVYAKVEWEILR